MNWTAVVNGEEDEKQVEALRRSVGRGAPFGEARWVVRTAARLKLESRESVGRALAYIVCGRLGGRKRGKRAMSAATK